MRITFWCLLLFISVRVAAQNVVLNCSFENYTTCPTNAAQVANCNQWRSYTVASPDYFNSCSVGNVGVPANVFGNEPAAHGQAYMGLVDYYSSNYREYIATTFPALTVNSLYEVSMSVSQADNCGSGSNGLGVYFFQNGPTTITGSTVLTVTPQVSFASAGPIIQKTGWVRMVGTFIADSAYTNLVIGGFLNNTVITTNPVPAVGYAYYYIDSVVVRTLTPILVTFAGGAQCRGASINVPYTVTGNIFTAGNVFTLQLSDASGSFAAPVNIGSVTSTTSGTITGTIPVNTPIGNGYRVRVVSTNPVHISNDNGANIIIAVPSLTASVNSPVCEGASIFLSANATGGSTFSWTGPSYSSTVQSPTIGNATLANAGDYIVTATLLGCIEKDTVTVVVNPLPSVTSAGNNGPVCEGATLNLTAQGTGSSYQWTGPSFASTQQNPSINNVTIAAQGNYSVTTSLNGCTSAPMVTNVVINATPVISNKGSNSPICAGGVLNLFANSNPSAVYSWTGPAGFTSALQNAVIDPAGTKNGGNYIITATLNNCTSKPDTVNVVVNTIAYLGAYASPNDTICEGDTVTFVTVPVNGGSNPQFQWYKNNAEIPGATTLKYPTAALVTGDSFYCRMIASNTCNTPITLFSDKIGVKVYPHAPAPTIAISSVPANPLPGNMVTFTVSITSGGSNPHIQWLRNGQDIIGAVSNTWSANNLNPYDKISVRVTSSEYCPDVATVESDKIEVNFPLGVNDMKGSKFDIYPNPNKGMFRLKGMAANSGEMQLRIIDITGRIVHKETLKAVNGMIDAEVTMPAPALPGMYLLQVEGEGIFAKVPVMVQ